MSVHDDERHVAQAVESIRAQTLAEWELIAVDDGSRDRSGAILDGLAAQDPRIRVIHHRNTGLTRALIHGCDEAAGDLIARQDADDVSHPERLEKQSALLEKDRAVGFVSCWTQYVGPEDEPLEVLTRPADSELATRELLDEKQGPPAHGSVMFRRSLYREVGGYRSQFYFGQDSDLWLRMADRAQIGYVPEVLYRARREVASISGSLRPLQRRFGQLSQACQAARQAGQSEARHLAAAEALTQEFMETRSQSGGAHGGGAADMAYVIGSRLVQDGSPRAAKYLWCAIRNRPWHWRAWTRLAQAGLGSLGVRSSPGSRA